MPPACAPVVLRPSLKRIVISWTRNTCCCSGGPGPRDDAEALGLLGMDGQAVVLAVRRQLEVEGEQLAVALGGGGDEGDGLPRDGVRDLHSGVCHAETVPAAASRVIGR